jgi:hypothetical protein
MTVRANPQRGSRPPLDPRATQNLSRPSKVGPDLDSRHLDPPSHPLAVPVAETTNPAANDIPLGRGSRHSSASCPSTPADGVRWEQPNTDTTTKGGVNNHDRTNNHNRDGR